MLLPVNISREKSFLQGKWLKRERERGKKTFFWIFAILFSIPLAFIPLLMQETLFHRHKIQWATSTYSSKLALLFRIIILNDFSRLQVMFGIKWFLKTVHQVMFDIMNRTIQTILITEHNWCPHWETLEIPCSQKLWVIFYTEIWTISGYKLEIAIVYKIRSSLQHTSIYL